MASGTASVRITGDVTQALAALESLGIKAEDTGARVESAFGDKVAGSMQGITAKLANLTSGMPVLGGYFDKLNEKMGTAATAGKKTAAAMSELGKALTLGLAAGAVAAGAESVKMAEGFQTSMTALVTGAGESESNLKMVSNGILNMAGSVGTSTSALASGMYQIESAGFHGAQGLSVLKAAAEGAKVGNADLETVAGAVTTALTDYSLKGTDATRVTSALVATTAAGKMHMEDLADSLGKVMPQAAALGVSFQQVTGAMATMTNAGLSARMASQHLSNTILAISAPSATAAKALESVGLSSQELKNELSSGGLTGAIQMVETHVGKTFPAGSVAAVNAFKNIMGGATGYSTALMLGGQHMAEFQANVKSIGSALNTSSTQVQGFSKVQKDLSFQLDQAKATGEALGIRLGDMLIPVLEDTGRVVGTLVLWFEKHKDVTLALGAVIGTVTGLFVAYTVGQAAATVATGAWAVVSGVAAVATGVFSGAMTVLGAVTGLATAPILLIILAVAALGVGIYELVTHWKEVWGEIKDVANDAYKSLDGVWHAVDTDSRAIWGDIEEFFKQWWPEILGVFTGGLGLIIGLVIQHWSQIETFTMSLWHDVSGFFRNMWSDVAGAVSSMASAVVNFFTGMWFTVIGDVSNGVGAVVNFFESLPGKVLNAISGLLGAMFSFGAHIMQQLISGIGSEAGSLASSISSTIGGALSHLPGGGELATILGVKKGAAGGYVTSPTLALIGEAGPEYVIPASLLTNAPALPGLPTGGGGGGGGAQAVQINMQMDKTTVATVLIPDIRTLLLQQQRRNSTRVGLS